MFNFCTFYNNTKYNYLLRKPFAKDFPMSLSMVKYSFIQLRQCSMNEIAKDLKQQIQQDKEIVLFWSFNGNFILNILY